MSSRIAQILRLKVPIMQAPMAGVSTAEMVVQVNNSGGLGSYGAGLFPASELKATIRAIQNRTDAPVNINLFVNEPPVFIPSVIEQSIQILNQIRRDMGLEIKQSPFKNHWRSPLKEQLDVVFETRPRVVSFCFGMLDQSIIQRLQDFALVMGTATTVQEAVALEAQGVDAIIAQGFEAGGHRATFLTKEEQGLIGTLSLVPQICRETTLPVIAAGGIMNAKQIEAVLAVGADMVSMGTAFITTKESKAAVCHKEALLNSPPSQSCLTRAMTGRMARMLENKVTKAFESVDKVPDYPLQSQLTEEFRTSSNSELRSLYCGQNYSECRNETARDLLKRLVTVLPVN